MNCRDCGEPIQFLEGDRRPYDLTPRVHYANPVHIAAKRQGKAPSAAQNGSRGPSVPGKPAFKVALELLIDMQYKKAEAKELLRDIPEGEPTDMVLAALKRKGA